MGFYVTRKVRYFFLKRLSPGLCAVFRNIVGFYSDWFLATRSNPKLDDHPLFGCPRLFFQYIRSYLPYLGHAVA
jgi:hypothetical protein